ncbi:MAG: hypothetical protein E7158_00025 [Firmicutes bacterium]|nr:hypothetical protein [Bacillota bacterium]
MKEEKNIEKKEKKISLFSFAIVLIGLFVVIVFLLLMSSSKTNFDIVKDGKEPSGYKEKIEYKKDDKEVIYYEYTIYKIEVIKDKEQISYTLKPFFSKNY